MKKFICMLLLLAAAFILPMNVFAEGEDGEDAAEEVVEDVVSNDVKVYFFRGDGCPHCQEAEEWFDSLEEDVKSKFTIVDYETWYNADNSDLMKKVAETRGESETATGVPYIIIGYKSWVGFSSDMEDEILSQIDSVYKQDVSKRYDVMDLLGKPSSKKDEKKSNDVLSLVIILVVVGGIGFGIFKARQSVN